ncbi:PilN domain-containing protein [Erwinia amylovora]|uniref:PilN domain-containing protein n=3 Tax=Erwinia amylovora TaxID=552 RepID=A0ABX7MJE9_ERWAM|nr:PilN domain-containing protein [Erwinia amylovora]CDK16753.1 putative fimbrial assembly protein hofN [Erwinia amylovora LA635]CDK20121.1 putative fimbrial assembly protein hofN [Erwinia amylovora LA636]CDK23492.1 putative fimbrial assembly protein hofN [Erwinia amylovora LA637]ATZ12970.1 fimbrial assembly protein [Erwinia amylovora]EKV52089.1 putative fimbrial assembly protein hofN [Erwinia amylovora ACW56400]
MVWVNLLPWRRAELQKRWRVWRLVVVGVLLLLTAGLCHGQWQRALNQRCATTVTLWSAAQKGAVNLKAQMLDARQHITRLQRQLDKRQFHQRQMAMWLNFARTLGQYFSTDAWLYTLRKSHLDLELRGAGRSINALHQLREGLSASPLFSDVTLGQIERVKLGEMKFIMLARLAVPGVKTNE